MSAQIWAREMTRLRDLKPSPLARMYGPHPSLQQTIYHRSIMRDWNTRYRHASKMWKQCHDAENKVQKNPKRARKRISPTTARRAQAAVYKRVRGNPRKKAAIPTRGYWIEAKFSDTWVIISPMFYNKLRVTNATNYRASVMRQPVRMMAGTVAEYDIRSTKTTP